jgi:hypothetical protein
MTNDSQEMMMEKVTVKLDHDVHAQLKIKALQASIDTGSTVTLSQVLRTLLEEKK